MKVVIMMVVMMIMVVIMIMVMLRDDDCDANVTNVLILFCDDSNNKFALFVSMLLAFHFRVFCDSDYMTAVFDRADLPKHLNVDRLYLRSRRCRASYNSTHVIVKTPLTGCGTVFSKDDQTLFFSNVLSEEQNSRAVGVITRDYLFKANLTCAYPRKRTVGSISFEPAKQRMFVNLSKCWIGQLYFLGLDMRVVQIKNKWPKIFPLSTKLINSGTWRAGCVWGGGEEVISFDIPFHSRDDQTDSVANTETLFSPRI